MKIAILTSPEQWYIPYAQSLAKTFQAPLFYSHEETKPCDILFILSYHKIIPDAILQQNRHNIVVHASDLPQGRGWAPLFWQVLEGKNDIVFTLFEAKTGADTGDWYLKESLHLNGNELYDELRKKQALHTNAMCERFIATFATLTPQPQRGMASSYEKRTPEDARLDANKSIHEQFNLLRICSNSEFPAFFYHNKVRYRLKIERDE